MFCSLGKTASQGASSKLCVTEDMGETGLLQGKTALVTGAGSGIGHAVAAELLAAGASVGLHYRSSREAVEQLVAKYGQAQCLAVEADFEDTSSPEEVFSAVWSWRGGLDILVNNAAWVQPINSIDEIDDAILAKSFRINSTAPFLLSKLALAQMRARKSGRIVSISSIGVKYSGSANTAHYMISKAALEAGTLALAKAGAADGVLVNVVRAGVTRTALHERLGRADLAPREALIPLKRAAEPAEIAKAVVFLVSPLNTYITGSIIPVAGGE